MTIETKHSWHDLGARRLEAAVAGETPELRRAAATDTPHPFAFTWGTCWTSIVQYQVDDYAAEIGFFLDGLGFTLGKATNAPFPMSPERILKQHLDEARSRKQHND